MATVKIVEICGLPGVGKTTLAVHGIASILCSPRASHVADVDLVVITPALYRSESLLADIQSAMARIRPSMRITSIATSLQSALKAKRTGHICLADGLSRADTALCVLELGPIMDYIYVSQSDC